MGGTITDDDIELSNRQASGQSNVRFDIKSEFIAPPPEFDGCFTTFYLLDLEVEAGTRVHDYLQPEWANIRFFAGAAPIAQIGDGPVTQANFGATGPSSLPCKFKAGSARMWGVGLLPLGWARFMDVPASQLTNIAVDGSTHPAFAKFASLSNVLCDNRASDSEKLEALITQLRALMKPNRDEAKILRVHNALLDSTLTSVAEFASEVAMSVRTLERICLRYFGFPPKLLMRRQRFMRSLTNFMLQGPGNWTDAIDELYHDQAHFTREFREFMTMSPSEYAALDHPILSAFMEARARLWGSPAQTLDAPER